MTRFGVAWPMGIEAKADPRVHAKSIANLGVKEVRVPMPWDQIERTQGFRDFSYFDWLVNEVIRPKGLGVLPIVYFSPSWHRDDRRRAPDPWTYAAFVVEVAAHFDFPAIEAWNEPDNPGVLDWIGTPEEYADMYRAARLALHDYDDSKDLLTAGLTYIDPVAYLSRIWGRLGPVDAVGFHPYGFGNPAQGGDPVEDSMQKMKRLAAWLSKQGSSAPIDVTEVGMAVGRDMGGYRYTEKQRSGYLRELASKVKAWKRIRRFDVYLWYVGDADHDFAIAKPDGNWLGGASGYHAGILS